MMAIIKTCCCGKSVRDGSFACGIYTMVSELLTWICHLAAGLGIICVTFFSNHKFVECFFSAHKNIYYTLFTTFGTFHLTPAIENKVLFVLGILALCVYGLCVMSSALLLVGLCADNRNFLIPWLICVSTATLLDVFLCFYFTAKDSSERFHSIFFATDFFFSSLNVYCLLCVISQYQEYSAGRGRPEDCIRMQVLNRVPIDEERVPEETRGGNLLTAPESCMEPANKLLQPPGLINPSDSMRCIVETCHKESFSENNTSVLSSEEPNETV